MPTSATPNVIDALVAAMTTALPNATVSDGFSLTQNPGDYLMIGVDAPETASPSRTAQTAQSAATLSTNRTRDETGTITLAAISWNGDGNQKAARDAAYASVAAVENYLRATPTLGLVPTYQTLIAEIGRNMALSQAQSDIGADAIVIFDVAFKARI